MFTIENVLYIKHYFIYMLVLFFSKYIVLEQKLLRLGCPHRETFRKKTISVNVYFFQNFSYNLEAAVIVLRNLFSFFTLHCLFVKLHNSYFSLLTPSYFVINNLFFYKSMHFLGFEPLIKEYPLYLGCR